MPESGIPAEVIEAIEPVVGAVVSAQTLSGGCIANATRIETASGTHFVKWAAGEAGAGFEGEAAGLRVLAGAAPRDVVIPEPLLAAAAHDGRTGYLLTTWLERDSTAPADGTRFGAALAMLHRAPPPMQDASMPYGFAVDTYCGPTRQPNTWMESWPAFFRERRLMPMAERLRATNRWQRSWDAPFDALLKCLDSRLPARPAPSLVHGDLWGGNTFPVRSGATALVDPAAYVGDREVDIAMTALFGGFSEAFYGAYREAWPLEPGYRDRATVYDLYHVMNHALIFGGSYLAAVARALAAADHGVLPGTSGARH